MDRVLIARVRQFNRFFSQRIGALDDHYLTRSLSLGQARMLWEISVDDGRDVRWLRTRLELDSGYASRLLRSLEAAALITVAPKDSDRRVHVARLTDAGKAERAALDAASDALA